ncbi:MAG: hypothetical protein EGQ74_20190 [Bacteroides nordii]|nr:hypothetical protein [Bacteroides nordii]
MFCSFYIHKYFDFTLTIRVYLRCGSSNANISKKSTLNFRTKINLNHKKYIRLIIKTITKIKNSQKLNTEEEHKAHFIL